MELLRKRRELRESLHDCADEDLAVIDSELSQVTKLARNVRRRITLVNTQALVEELWEH